MRKIIAKQGRNFSNILTSAFSTVADRFSHSGYDKYQAIVIKVLSNPDKIYHQPATFLAPGLPIKTFTPISRSVASKIPYGVFGTSFIGGLSLQKTNQDLYIFDANSDYQESDNSQFPISIPAAFYLYAKSLDKTPAASFSHNEMKPEKSDFVTCAIDLERFHDVTRFTNESKGKLPKDLMCHYDQDAGKFYYLDSEGQKAEEIIFPENVLSLGNYQHREEVREFVDESYKKELEIIAKKIEEEHEGIIPERYLKHRKSQKYDHNFRNPADILLEDVQAYLDKNLIKKDEPRSAVKSESTSSLTQNDRIR